MKSNFLKYSGIVSGACLAITLFFPFLSAIPLLLILVVNKSTYSKIRLILFSISILLIFWISIKDLLINNLNYFSLVRIFPLLLISLLSFKSIEKEFLRGLYIAVILLFTIDIIFNINTLLFGSDLLGRVPESRIDGNRVGGLMGHSFSSLAISSSFMLLALLMNKKNIILFGVANFILTGSMRAYIYIFCFFIYSIFLNNKRWAVHFLFALLLVFLIVALTYISVTHGYINGKSGNYYRIFAWENSISEVLHNPYLGSWRRFEVWNEDLGINEDTIIATGTTESALLSDLLFYGLFLTLGKLMIFSAFGNYFHKCLKTDIYPNENRVISFLLFSLLIDYFIGSLWGGILISFIVTLILMYGISLAESKSRLLKEVNFSD